MRAALRAADISLAAVLCTVAFPAGARAADWPQWGRTPDRNMISEAKGLPDSFDVGQPDRTTRGRRGMQNVKWAAQLGRQTYGNPAIAGGKVFVGTNNDSRRDPKYAGDRGVLMCFREADGKFLWQLVTPKLRQGGRFHGDHPGLGICSPPTVEGGRVYVVTNRCEVLCLDAAGLADGNDGPFTDEAHCLAKPQAYKVLQGTDGPIVTMTPGEPVKLAPADADIIWRFDMIAQAKSWPEDASSSAVLVHGKYLYVGTSNGVNRVGRPLASPNAPCLIVLDKATGRLVAADDAAVGNGVFHGQWSSPALGAVKGRAMVFYGAGNGFCYAFDARPTPPAAGRCGVLRKVWWFDGNPPGYRRHDGRAIRYKSRIRPKPADKPKTKGKGKLRQDDRPGGIGPSEIIATPVFHKNRVYVGVGQDPRHGLGKGCLSCIDATKTGDISKSGSVWVSKDVDRTLSTVSIADGLVYVADYTGILRCLDADTGKCLWQHDTASRVWGSTLVADGKVYLGTEKGRLWILAAGKKKKVINNIDMKAPVYTTPVVANGVLYVASQKYLYAVQAEKK